MRVFGELLRLLGALAGLLLGLRSFPRASAPGRLVGAAARSAIHHVIVRFISHRMGRSSRRLAAALGPRATLRYPGD